MGNEPHIYKIGIFNGECKSIESVNGNLRNLSSNLIIAQFSACKFWEKKHFF